MGGDGKNRVESFKLQLEFGIEASRARFEPSCSVNSASALNLLSRLVRRTNRSSGINRVAVSGHLCGAPETINFG